MAVLSKGTERSEYVQAFLEAAAQLGAHGFSVGVAGDAPGQHGSWNVGATPLAGNRPAIEALKKVDLLVDTVFLLFSKEQLEIQAAGVRVLLCIEPVDHLREMFPDPTLRARVEAAGELLGKASSLRLLNKHGTDVTYDLGAYPVITQYGYTDTPGRWDHFPSGFVFTGASDDGVNGKVVLGPGDIIYPFKTYVRTPIELTIEQGWIKNISGDLDAELLAEYMAGFNDPKAYGVSHIGWGLLESAKWSALATDQHGVGMHGRSYYGNVMFATGPNQELGGPNDTECHLDIPMRGATLLLDDEPVVVDGDIVIDSMKPASRS
ncbi:leucyl aminopeptidase [Pseudonocardia sp. H11422]|uniref:leucyl aminopeptidase n=1 Tax=Pseudonocardia sp. H11422 TaxID=2835866 RepID=UPI0027E25AA5|nr:leucyl aminopeptidase [Pseudonocardia sp. H11422]